MLIDWFLKTEKGKKWGSGRAKKTCEVPRTYYVPGTFETTILSVLAEFKNQ